MSAKKLRAPWVNQCRAAPSPPTYAHLLGFRFGTAGGMGWEGSRWMAGSETNGCSLGPWLRAPEWEMPIPTTGRISEGEQRLAFLGPG